MSRGSLFVMADDHGYRKGSHRERRDEGMGMFARGFLDGCGWGHVSVHVGGFGGKLFAVMDVQHVVADPTSTIEQTSGVETYICRLRGRVSSALQPTHFYLLEHRSPRLRDKDQTSPRPAPTSPQTTTSIQTLNRHAIPPASYILPRNHSVFRNVHRQIAPQRNSHLRNLQQNTLQLSRNLKGSLSVRSSAFFACEE